MDGMKHQVEFNSPSRLSLINEPVENIWFTYIQTVTKVNAYTSKQKYYSYRRPFKEWGMSFSKWSPMRHVISNIHCCVSEVSDSVANQGIIKNTGSYNN